MNKPILYLLLFLPFFGFAQKELSYPQAVNAILVKAGKNRGELEKTIVHFKKTKDTLKLKAAYFLISNMDIHYSMDYYWENRLGKRIPFNELNYKNLNEAASAFEQLKAKHPDIHPHPFRTEDINTVKAEFLIRNIDQAFKVWRGGNYKKLSFQNFCEYILPYRVSVEPLQDWRGIYESQFQWLHDKMMVNGLTSALTYEAVDVQSWFSNTFSWGNNNREPLPRLGALQLLLRKKAPCEDIADLIVFSASSQGIPSAIDYIPAWATSTNSHFLNTVFDKGMKPIQFDAAGAVAVNTTLNREPGKVVRLTYAKQKVVIAASESLNNIPLGFMRTRNYVDVTSEFWATVNVQCQLNPAPYRANFAYACVFNGLQWRPIWFGSVKNDRVTFGNMSKGVVYLPTYCRNGKIIPAGYPVAEGYRHELTLQPDLVNKKTIIIKEQAKYLAFQTGKRYSLYYWDGAWKSVAKQVAGLNIHEMIFPNVPANALYLLIPEYSERKERPFMVTDDQILWW